MGGRVQRTWLRRAVAVGLLVCAAIVVVSGVSLLLWDYRPVYEGWFSDLDRMSQDLHRLASMAFAALLLTWVVLSIVESMPRRMWQRGAWFAGTIVLVALAWISGWWIAWDVLELKAVTAPNGDGGLRQAFSSNVDRVWIGDWHVTKPVYGVLVALHVLVLPILIATGLVVTKRWRQRTDVR